MKKIFTCKACQKRMTASKSITVDTDQGTGTQRYRICPVCKLTICTIELDGQSERIWYQVRKRVPKNQKKHIKLRGDYKLC